ncbi:carotenoid 1,2-hydratase [Variovorax rhizosphaerae]|uniref:Carotenoid 1,2-hydratase n=1 Tax=Variovorax rhizosphaerae TaxID=1836200 RepID=A0ABU8WTZ4_9BURK
MAPGGYAWWYVDALSDDGRHGLTIIGFVGSVFSPYYARARRRAAGGAADPLDHCALNVALYGDARSDNRWAMTERGRRSVQRDATTLRIGPSIMRWDGDVLVFDIDEVTVPIPSRLRGQVRVHPAAIVARSFALDDTAHHHWRPIAPCARVEVALSHPSLKWRGTGYLDSNTGTRPLEQDFPAWEWSRGTLRDGRTVVLYDVTRRDAEPLSLAVAFDPSGGIEAFEPPGRAALPRTGWRMDRSTRSTAGHAPKVLQTFEDAPFYSRSLIESHLLGERVTAVHESLSLERFAAPWCQWMLPFRMPRNA